MLSSNTDVSLLFFGGCGGSGGMLAGDNKALHLLDIILLICAITSGSVCFMSLDMPMFSA